MPISLFNNGFLKIALRMISKNKKIVKRIEKEESDDYMGMFG